MHPPAERIAFTPAQVEVVDGQHRHAQPALPAGPGQLRGERGLAAALHAGDGVHGRVAGTGQRIVENPFDQGRCEAAGRNLVRSQGHRATILKTRTHP